MPSLPKPSHQEPRPLYGIGLKVLSVMIFVGMQTCLKAVGDDVPAGQLVFFRSFFALIPVVIYLWWLGDLRTALATDDVGGHFIRGIVGVTSMGLGFFALSRLPYPEWISLSYGAPLLTVVFAAIFLKEVVRAYRWVAVLVGLCGIVIVAAPNFSLSSGDMDSAHAVGALASLGGAAMAAIAMIQVRRLVAHEKTATIVVYFSMTCSIIALVTVPFGWVVPDGRQAMLLVGAGLCGGVGQLLLTACYRYADTSTIAPFEYTSMIAAVVIGYFVFNEEVTATTLLGACIVISAGLFIIFREHRLGLERRRARKVSPPSP
ncbi:Permease of the drug/metabolite transporter (DMT) superfamily [Aureimonas altamirensis DSM 21988]|uniref:Permease of the drug/metabolite transporter (DMT) superfamily n=1 Tax=Aureimonas altamirensis DSM 21988 TaxID=1121026 RepID=A0ABY1I5G1_9HYPH|nr:DMT family transporter [Aureimonas altamirensis]UHD44840.1 DMT family transporter [Aureimonas altamirensis]SHI52647.1 Permease of the drug/metabolite transporter (DMT) superfamily [Aureimonas altamirensis DSM 21988]